MSNLIEQIIRSELMSQYMFSRVTFDNAKDTNELHQAIQLSHDTLVQALIYKLEPRIEQLLIERLESSLEKGEFVVRIGNGWFKITEATEAGNGTD